MIRSSLKGMHARDWVALVAIAAVVAFCGVFGSSYVLGEGYAFFDAVQSALLFVGATVMGMVVLFFVDAIFAKLVTPRDRRIKTTDTAADDSAPAGDIPVGADTRIGPRNQGAEASAAADASDKSKKRRKSKKGRAQRILSKITPRWCVKSILLFSLIMFVLWLPWFIANLPGSSYWDTYYQIYMTYPENHPISIIPFHGHKDDTVTDAWLTDHHPVLTTLIYGAFGRVSDWLTGNWMAGVFTYVLIQVVLTIVVLTASVAYLRSRKCPLWLCFVAYVFFAIMPFVSTWAICMVKDSMFTLFFIPYLMMLAEAVRTRGATFCRPHTIVLFALCALMLCLTKKTGLFIVIPVTIVGVWLFRPRKIHDQWVGKGMVMADPEAEEEVQRQAKRPALSFLIQGFTCIVIAGLLLPYAVFPLANIAPGGRQETLGPMLQQTARFLVDHDTAEVTTEEYYAIKNIIDYNTIRNIYEYNTQDPVKYSYNLDTTNEELVEYFKAYVTMGMKDPEAYFAALMSIAGCYVAPVDYLNIRMVTVDTKMGEDNRPMLWNHASLEPMRLGMDEAYKTIAGIPVLNIPLLMVTYVLWIPAMLLYTMLRRRIKCGVVFLPLLVLIGFCVIAPVDDARYVIPIFDTLPLFICYMAVFLRQKLAAHRWLACATIGDIQSQNPRTIYVKRARTSTIGVRMKKGDQWKPQVPMQ